MAIPRSKSQLQKEIIVTYEKLEVELNSIPREITRNKELTGHAKGTVMSVCDLVAYLIGWGQLVIKWNYRKEKNMQVDFPETGFKWNELGNLAQKFYEDYKNESYKELLHKLDKTIKEILKLVENKTDRQLYSEFWYEKYPLGRMIQLNTSSPYKNAKDRIRKWKKIKKLK